MLKVANSVINASQITGVLPVVNGGTGVTTSTGTGSTVLSAAPTLSGNVTLSTGNLIIASGQGIDFSATPGTGTSELLNDYEEGTWTPATDGSATYTSRFGTYTKIGRVVTIQYQMVINTIGSGNPYGIVNLPFATAATNTQYGTVGNFAGIDATVTWLYSYMDPSANTLYFGGLNSAGSSTTVPYPLLKNGTTISGSATYVAA